VNESGSPDTSSSLADASTGTVSCNDGTGLADCCPDGVVAGGDCGGQPSMCWTTCHSGYRGAFYCGGGNVWNQGKGEYPCGRQDAGEGQ
jgi:hypothetical protein